MSFGSDNFLTLLAGVELNGRTASGGGSWSGTTGVLSGTAVTGTSLTNTTNSGRGQQIYSTAPTGTDYSVQATMTQANNNRNSLGLVVRHTGAFRIYAYYDAGGSWRIVRRDDNNGDTRLDSNGSGTNPPGTGTRTVVLTVSGTSPSITLTLTSDGTTVASATLNNTSYDAKGQAGIYYINTDSSAFCTLDDWQADDTATGINSGAWSAAGVGAMAAVGASIAAGAMSSAGTSAMPMVGAAIGSGVLNAAGVGTFGATGTAIMAGVMNAAGASTVAWVGSDGANYQTGAWASAGEGTFPAIGASIAAGAMLATGSSTADWRAVPEVTPATPVVETFPGPGGGAKSGYTWAEAQRRREEAQRRKREMVIAAVKGIAPAVFQAMSRPGYIHIPGNRTLH